MTEKRIRDIIVENDVHLTDVIIKAMKQAVNEALEEAADSAEVDVSGNGVWKIDKSSILKLQLK